MVNARDWRAVLDAYLLAVREDEVAHRRQALFGAESEFLSRFGGESLRERRARRLQLEMDAVSQLEVMPMTVVKESAEEVVVQMNSRATGREIPLITMRFLLVRYGSGWLVEGLFRPCPQCNVSALLGTGTWSRHEEPGRCSSCQGSGKGYAFSWRSILSRSGPVLDRPPCQLCKGTGKCSGCEKEPEPGWLSIDTMYGVLRAGM